MLKAIREFFDRTMAPTPDALPGSPGHDPAQVAACAILLELAHADEEFSDAERAHIEEALQRHFALDPATARDLMALADRERRGSVDLYQFTSLIVATYDEGQRMVLAEIMWRVVFADGELQKHESYLMRKLSALLELRPGFLAEARQRASASGDADAG